MIIQNEERREALIHRVDALAEELAAELETKIQEDAVASDVVCGKLVKTFRKCFVNTVETTVTCLGANEIFLITGDIEAMWLRDSSSQVEHYLPYMKREPELQNLVKGLLAKQFQQILIDPYANAFNVEPNGACWAKDRTADTPWDWERKYEIDSLCYPVRLLHAYYAKTKDKSVFTGEVHKALRTICSLFQTEQKHETESDYYFERDNCPATDTLSNGGKGTPVAETGMLWSGFRPSDDACTYGYLIPSNLLAVVVCGYIAEFAEQVYGDRELTETAELLQKQIRKGIAEYGVVEKEGFGKIYAYEVDGLGHVNCMDDANVPSLLSLPWLGCLEKEDMLYQNTRRFILSKKNPYYYEGTKARGIGSPHTPPDYIWPIALSMQGLTSNDKAEQKELLETLLRCDAGTGYMHEGFHVDRPEEFTRPWFAWSNSMFALFVENLFELGHE